MESSYEIDDNGHLREGDDANAYHSNDPFDIHPKGPVERLKEWRAVERFKQAGRGAEKDEPPEGFQVGPKTLIHLLQDRNLPDLEKLGGVRGLAWKLGTNLEEGVKDDPDEIQKRTDAYGSNTYPKKKPKGLCQVQPDKVFRREGADIYVNVPVPFTHAILGGLVQVPTLTGDVVLKIRSGTQPGHKQVMKGKGVKVLNLRHYGDQYVLINVTLPQNITQRQRQLLEEFAREDSAEPESCS